MANKSRQQQGKSDFRNKFKGKKPPAGKPNNKDKDYGTSEQSFNEGNTMNDAAFWNQYPELLKPAANIQFELMTGSPFKLNNPADTSSNTPDIAVPGICTLHVIPSMGVSLNEGSPINTAAVNLYTKVRQYNSGAPRYLAPDLMLYVYSISEAYALIVWLQRLYGLVSMPLSDRNKYINQALVECQGLDFNDLKANLANYQYEINLLITQLSAFAVPGDMQLFRRMAMLFRDVYIEGTSLKDQMYMLVPVGFHKYEIVPNEDKAYMGTLQFVHVPEPTDGKLIDYKTLFNYVHEILNPIFKMDDDFGTMSQNIRAIWGSNILKLVTMPAIYPVVPIFDIAILEQIKNAVCVGNLYTYNITQDHSGGFLISQPTAYTKLDDGNEIVLNTLAGAYKQNKLLTTTTDSTDPILVMENTRFIPYIFKSEPAEDSPTVNVVLGCGSEFATHFHIWFYTYNRTTGARTLEDYTYRSYDVKAMEPWSAAVGTIQELSKMSHFKFHPFYQIIPCDQYASSEPKVFQRGCLFTDIDNYAVLSNENIYTLNEAAMMSLLKSNI